MSFIFHNTPRYRASSSHMGDVRLSRKADGAEVYFQPGDDADSFWDLYAAAEQAFLEDETRIDNVLSAYDDVMTVEETP